MKYFYVNKYMRFENHPVVMKVSNKAFGIVSKMSKLIYKHRQLERVLIEELTKINNMGTDEVDEIMCNYDFLVDSSQYAVNCELAPMITKKEYTSLKGVK